MIRLKLVIVYCIVIVALIAGSIMMANANGHTTKIYKPLVPVFVPPTLAPRPGEFEVQQPGGKRLRCSQQGKIIVCR